MKEKVRIGIDMGGMSIKFGMVGETNQILEKEDGLFDKGRND